MGAKQISLIGKRFGKLVVVEQAPSIVYGKSKKRVWNCVCDCNKLVLNLHTGALTSGNTTSCGCYHNSISAENGKKSRQKVVNPEAGYTSILYTYKRSASLRNLPFSLTIDEFKLLITSDCYYCGSKPSNLYNKTYYKMAYNGIDRKDNNVGYTIDNCVPCCKMCNIAKNNNTFIDFEKWILAIFKHTAKRIIEYSEDLIQMVNDNPNDYDLGKAVREFVK